MEDKARFAAACAAAQQLQTEGGIGTLGEKLLHAAIKCYIEPDPTRHEQKVGRFVADILTAEGQIFEVQTGSFTPLRRKLEKLLPEHRVTVVYPVAHRKEICWVDPQSGEISAPRRSPKTGSLREIYYELPRILPCLGHPNLRIRILLIDLTEYRLQNGWGRDGKRGSNRSDRIPHDLFAVYELPDYRQLLPPGLPEGAFTFREFTRCAGLSPRACRGGLAALLQLGLLEKAGKEGRAFLYRTVTKPNEPSPCAMQKEGTDK